MPDGFFLRSATIYTSMIENLVYGRLNDTSITTYTSDRVYNTDVPQNTQWPFVVFQITASETNYSLAGASGLASFDVEITCEAKSQAVLTSIANAVKSRLSGYKGGNVQGCFLKDEGDERIGDPTEGDIYQANQVYKLHASPANIQASADSTGRILTLNNSITMTACSHTLELGCDGLTLDGVEVGSGGSGGTGPQGPPGSKWNSNNYLGGNPGFAANDDDLALDTSNGNVWQSEGGSWFLQLNLTGPQGPQGNNGADSTVPGPQGDPGPSLVDCGTTPTTCSGMLYGDGSTVQADPDITTDGNGNLTVTDTITAASGQFHVNGSGGVEIAGVINLEDNGTIGAVQFVGGGASITGLDAANVASGTLPIVRGGTGQTTAANAINALLPTQTGNAGKVLTTNATAVSWTSPATGTVTSVSGSGGTTGLTLTGGAITGSGTLTLGGTLGIANGGSGQTTANTALNAFLPTQTGNANKHLATDGTNTSWATPTTGTVTSVSGSGGSTGLTLTGGAITTSGTLTLGGTLAVANGGTGMTSNPFPLPITFLLALGAPASTGTNKTAAVVVPRAGTITKCFAYAKTGPTGADLICDINLNGTTIWSTQANRIKIVASATSGTQTSFNTTSVSEGDILTIDVDQIGSTVAGQDITITLLILCQNT